ncbi:MAG: hypothetical protein R6V58_00715 [Planctomycetota bacterium]
MAASENESTAVRFRWWLVLPGLAAYAVIFSALAWLAAVRCPRPARALVLMFAECSLLSVAAIGLAASADPAGLAACFRRVVVGLLPLAAVSVALSVAAGVAPWTALAGAQVVIVAFCVLLAAVFLWVRCVGGEPFPAQFVTVMAGAGLMGTVFYANPLVERDQSPEARGRVIRVVLAVNPMAAISYSLLRFDMMRRQLMYDRISVIARWYRVTYPAWWQTACGYAAAAGLLAGAAGVCHRFRLRLRGGAQ